MRSGQTIRVTARSLTARRVGENDPVNAYSDRITVDSRRMGGRPCIRHTRLTVAMVLEYLAAGRTHSELLADYPYLEAEDISAALEFAAARMSERELPASLSA
ncbi:MAG: DUF433 domain-containing protein [Acidimicrobiaceae bacterium]|nr:DUF433 domain-containing protein [Acidimicrobiaceae bacterium]MDE0320381.1 DUF433 domain-containing protein [Acidimicrobiaceae bacterium]